MKAYGNVQESKAEERGLLNKSWKVRKEKEKAGDEELAFSERHNDLQPNIVDDTGSIKRAVPG